MNGLRWSALLATAVGLATGAWALGRTGIAATLAVVTRVGFGGFVLVLIASAVTLLVLGAALACAKRDDAPHRFLLFAWSRTVREGANDWLPFSQVGGLVIGMRVLAAAGVPVARVGAATLIDLATEMMSQALLTLMGVALFATALVAAPGHARLEASAWIGAATLAGITTAFVLLQRPVLKIAGALAGRILPAVGQGIEAAQAELAVLVRQRRALLLPFLLNLVAWLCSVGVAWLILTLLGVRIGFFPVLALETLIFAVRSGAFVVPGAIGVQEAAYVLIAPALGIDRESALALSLVKRARELVLGLPALLAWQWGELRALRRGVRVPAALPGAR